MKGFDRLTDAEILALTPDQITYYMDLACAEDGAPLMPPDPGTEPEKPAYQPDVTLHSCGGFLFFDAETAARVADVVNGVRRAETKYVHGPGYQKTAHVENDPVKIGNEKVYSPELWDRIKSEVNDYGERKKSWDSRVKEREEAARARDRVTSWIREKIEQVRDDDYQRQRYERELTRYIELAEGDRYMALRFLFKAHPEAEKYLPSADVMAASMSEDDIHHAVTGE